MKKYLQFNNPHYREIRSDVGALQPQISHAGDPSTSNRTSGVIDFSGRPGTNSITMVTGQKWLEPQHEQECALDLSRSRFEIQEEALDLSKPSTSRPDRPSSQSYQPTQTVNQSHRLVHTPPASRQARSPAGQPYSLLQAALNSSHPTAGLLTISQPSALGALLEQRATLFAGSSFADYGRTIKPFTTMSSRPLGITVPQMSHTSGAVIQGTHKPIAITTPQPHNSSVTTKSENLSNTTVSAINTSQSIPSTCNQGYSVSQSNYSSGSHSHISRQLNSVKMDTSDKLKSLEQSKDPVGGLVERYLIQPPEGLSRIIGSVHMIPTETLAGFSCKQCTKTFKTKAALKLHTTVHKTAEERQYACTVCGRRFLHRHHLVVHQRKHSGEKPFKCNACSKTFMAIFLLHKHLRKHTRETGAVSQISINQLKQLHDKKLISENKNTLQALSARSHPFDTESVIVLDDEEEEVGNNSVEGKKVVADESGKLDRKRYENTKSGNILDVLENDPHLILERIKADLHKRQEEKTDKEIKSKTKRVDTGIKNDIKFKQPTDQSMNVAKATEFKTEQTGEVNTDAESKEDFDNTTDLLGLNVEASKATAEPVTEIKQEVIEESMPELTPENIEKTPITKVLNPFPEYSSDDEVDLDPITGEFKVMGKKEREPEMSSEKEITAVKKEIMDTSEKEVRVETENTEVHNGEDKTADEERQEYGLGMQVTVVKEEVKVEFINSKDIKDEIVDSAKTDLKEANNDIKGKTFESFKVPEVLTSTTENNEKLHTNTSEQKHEIRESQVEERKTTDKANDNIFEKLSEIRSGSSVKASVKIKEEDHRDKIDKEVAVILSRIKQKLCEMEDGSSKPKKPKLESSTEVHKDAVKLPSAEKSDSGGKPVDISSTEIIGDCSNKSSSASGRRGKKKGKKVKCEVCGRSFHSNHYLVLHMAVHKRNPMLQSLKKAKDYQMKALGFISKTNVTCEVCNKVFKFQKSLNSHMRVHSEKMIQTKLYRKAFRDFMAEAAPPSSRSVERSQSLSHELESHNRSLSISDTSASKDTGKTLPAIKQISYDGEDSNVSKDDQYDDPPIRIMVGEDGVKRYLCHACDNMYTTKQKLRMHALIHKDNCFLCDICGKSFFRHITLEKHLSTHKLPRPHICNVCKKSFIHKSSLMRHRVIHDKTNIANAKQNTSDISFEMKMLDTYTMLRQEQINKLNGQQPYDMPKVDQFNVKHRIRYDPMDLTVRIRSEDCLPPVLSPVSYQSTSQANPWNLSPPLITQETSSKSSDRLLEGAVKTLEKDIKVNESEAAQSLEMMSRQRTESTCSESDIAVEGHHIVKKKSRKTRVYQTSCRFCKEVFPNVMLLKSHMAVHNTVETHLYECHICRHRFTQSCSLLRHLKTSCQENRMKCVPCGRTFHRRNTFEQHMRLHQGGPSGLDESFYDHRPDEIEIVEARESDIENNNLAKLEQGGTSQDSSSALLKLDLIKTLTKNIPADKIVDKTDGHETDSDARTYLYSEGEVHSRYNSDCSDTEWTPPPSPRKSCTPEDLSVNSANATMTLNLLSAICSDIREAEQEQEKKRKEMEEKQKELETIEILANLKRGVIQKTISSTSSVADLLQMSSAAMLPKSIPNVKTVEEKMLVDNFPKAAVSTSFAGKTSVPTGDKSSVTSPSVLHMLDDRLKNIPSASDVSRLDTNSHNHLSQIPNTSTAFTSTIPVQRIPSVIESNQTPSEPKIPVTVLEVAAEADRRRKERAEKVWHGKLTNSVPKPADCNVARHSLQNEMSQMKVHYPSIEERLSLLMKAQITPPNPGPQASPPLVSQKSPSQPVMPPQVTPSFQFHPPVSTVLNSSKSSLCIYEDMPQDLSMKRYPLEPKSAPVTSMSRTFSAELSRLQPLHDKRLSESPRYTSTDLQRSVEGSAGLQRSMSLERLRSEIQKPAVSESVKSNQVERLKYEVPLSDISRLLPVEMPRSRTEHSMSLERSGSKPVELSRAESTDSSRSATSRSPSVPRTSANEEAKLPSSVAIKSEALETLLVRSSENTNAVSRSVPSNSKRSESASSLPPPLVPMYQCELCSRSLYNKTDLHLHMMEHGRSAGRSASALYAMLSSGAVPPLLQPMLPSDKPIDFTGGGTRKIETPPRPIESTPTLTPPNKPVPPMSLDLSGKKSENQNKTFNQSVSRNVDISPGSQSEPSVASSAIKESLSPVTSSDISESLSSPSTPSGSGPSLASVDVLRQELRLKIFSRRRSQGLDDLKVEFKTPEPTEMSEAEKLKLLYRRECNRQAAQRSRMRKKDLVDSLLEKLSQMPNVKTEPKADP